MTTAILLAAGSSRRMGDKNKLLLDYCGEPMIRYTAKHLVASDIDHIIAVTGHDEEIVKSVLVDLPIDIIHNPDHIRGMVTSIKVGLSVLPEETSQFMVMLGDMPLMTSAHLNLLLQFASEQKNNPIIRPISINKDLGHPVIFDPRYIEEIRNCSDGHSLKSVIKANISSLIPFVTEDRAYFTDMDTPQEYHQLNI